MKIEKITCNNTNLFSFLFLLEHFIFILFIANCFLLLFLLDHITLRIVTDRPKQTVQSRSDAAERDVWIRIYVYCKALNRYTAGFRYTNAPVICRNSRALLFQFL